MQRPFWRISAKQKELLVLAGRPAGLSVRKLKTKKLQTDRIYGMLSHPSFSIGRIMTSIVIQKRYSQDIKQILIVTG